MTGAMATVPLVVFEAAGCLMAVPASEIRRLVQGANDAERRNEESACDLDEYFGAQHADGPWLMWVRGTRRAWLRVRRVIDVVSVPMSAFSPLPKLLRRRGRSAVFVAAGASGADVFLLLDPARLTPDDRPTFARLRVSPSGGATAGKRSTMDDGR